MTTINQLVNGDFSKGSVGWYWGDPDIVIDYSIYRSAPASLRLDTTTAVGVSGPERSTYESLRHPVHAGQRVVLKGWVKIGPVDGGSEFGGGRFGVDCRMGETIVWDASVTCGYVQWGSDWTFRQVEVVVPEGVDSAVVWVSADPSTNPSPVWFDDLELYILEPGEEPPPITPPPVMYPCPFCDLEFPTEQELAAHIVSEHPTPNPSLAARVPCFGNKALVQVYLRKLRDKVFNRELHEKLHPLV